MMRYFSDKDPVAALRECESGHRPLTLPEIIGNWCDAKIDGHSWNTASMCVIGKKGQLIIAHDHPYNKARAFEGLRKRHWHLDDGAIPFGTALNGEESYELSPRKDAELYVALFGDSVEKFLQKMRNEGWTRIQVNCGWNWAAGSYGKLLRFNLPGHAYKSPVLDWVSKGGTFVGEEKPTYKDELRYLLREVRAGNIKPAETYLCDKLGEEVTRDGSTGFNSTIERFKRLEFDRR